MSGKLKSIFQVFVAVAFIIFIIISINRHENEYVELRKNGVLLPCKITDITFSKRSDYAFEFYYNGKKLYGESKSAVGSSTYFIGQHFPLMYSPESGQVQILIAPGDFNMFQLEYPDSLSWVLEYQKN